jgi:hypothetical protein
MGVEQSWVSVIKGLVLLAAVAFDLLSKQQDRPPIFGFLSRRQRKVEQHPAEPGPVEVGSGAAT